MLKNAYKMKGLRNKTGQWSFKSTNKVGRNHQQQTLRKHKISSQKWFPCGAPGKQHTIKQSKAGKTKQQQQTTQTKTINQNTNTNTSSCRGHLKRFQNGFKQRVCEIKNNQWSLKSTQKVVRNHEQNTLRKPRIRQTNGPPAGATCFPFAFVGQGREIQRTYYGCLKQFFRSLKHVRISVRKRLGKQNYIQEIKNI